MIRNPQSAIRIEPGQENFEIQYTALSFINSENLRFKYKLEGLDHDWVEAGTRRTAYFSHVPPGDYTFKVIAANSDGVWNEGRQEFAHCRAAAVLSDVVVSDGLLALGVAGVIWVGYQFRVTQLEAGAGGAAGLRAPVDRIAGSASANASPPNCTTVWDRTCWSSRTARCSRR